MNAYTKHEEQYVNVKAQHGSNGWIELENGDFMQELNEDGIAQLLTHGITEFYIKVEDGEIVAKPFENLGLFGAQPEPAMRFAKARLDFVRI